MKMNKRKKIQFNSYVVTGIVLLCIPVLLSICGSVFGKFDPLETNPLLRIQKPEIEHLMGTDDVGRDIFARIVVGIRVSLFIGILVSAISGIVGMIAGICAAYYPKTAKFIMGIIDGIMAFPTIILAITLAGILGAGTTNIIIALSISYFPSIARVARNSTLQVMGKEYMDSVTALGKSDFYIIFHYVIPNIISQVMVQIVYTFAMAILHESILSFLGVGIKVPTPSLGGMVSDGRNYISVAPWIITFPGIIIAWIVFALNILGDGLQEILDPKNNRG